MSRQVFFSVLNAPEVGVRIEIAYEDPALLAEFSKPYALDPVWADLDTEVNERTGLEASWSDLSTLAMRVEPKDAEQQALKLWATLVTPLRAKSPFAGRG